MLAIRVSRPLSPSMRESYLPHLNRGPTTRVNPIELQERGPAAGTISQSLARCEEQQKSSIPQNRQLSRICATPRNRNHGKYEQPQRRADQRAAVSVAEVQVEGPYSRRQGSKKRKTGRGKVPPLPGKACQQLAATKQLAFSSNEEEYVQALSRKAPNPVSQSTENAEEINMRRLKLLERVRRQNTLLLIILHLSPLGIEMLSRLTSHPQYSGAPWIPMTFGLSVVRDE